MTYASRLLTAGLTLSLCTLPAFSAEITVTGEWVYLGDVAPVSGSAATRPIAASPQAGQRMPLSAAFIEAQAQAAGYPVNLADGETFWITRYDASAVQPRRAQPVSQNRSAFPSSQAGLVPMLTQSVRNGEPITPDMISMEKPDPKRRVIGLIEDPIQLEGMEASRTLRAGQPLSMNDIEPLSVVKKGDPVQLIYEAGAMRLTVSAKALNDAARGEAVRVVNLQSNRTMDAIAWAPGEARVGSAAS